MSEKATKIVIISLLVLILFSAVGLVYYYLFGKEAPKEPSSVGGSAIFPEAAQNEPAGTNRTGSPSVRPRETTSERELMDAKEISSGASAATILNTRNISERPGTAPFFVVKQDLKTKVKSLSVRYMERGTGHIYELGTGNPVAEKISDTTLTKIHSTLFGRDGKTVVTMGIGDTGTKESLYGYLEDKAGDQNESFIGKLSTSRIPGDVRAMAASPDRTKLFYLSGLGEEFIGYTSDFTEKTLPSKKNQVFSSPVGSWNVSWPTANTIAFATKPSSKIPGFLYFLNLRTNTFEKVLGDVNGLTAIVSPDAKKIIYTASSKGNIDTYVYSVEKNESVLLPIKTFTDKCAWSSLDADLIYCAIPGDLLAGNYPDDWYQGLTTFTDEIWKIDTKTLKTEIVAGKNLFQKDNGVDAESLSLSPDEDYIAFLNKKNSAPWLVKIK